MVKVRRSFWRIRRRRAPFNSFDSICAWAASLAQGVQIPSWTAVFDLAKPRSRSLLRRHQRDCSEPRLAITELSTHLQGQLVAVNPPITRLSTRSPPRKFTQAGGRQQGRAADALRRQGLKTPRAHRARELLRRSPGLRLSLAAARAGLIETALRTGAALAADPRRVRDAGCDVAYEIHPGEDILTAPLSSASSRRWRPQRCNILYDPRISCCNSSTISLSSTSITSGSKRSTQGRRVQSDRAPGRLFGYAPWVERAGLPFAGRRSRRLRRHLLENGAIRLLVLAVLEWMLPEAPGRRRAEGAEFINQHIIRVTEKAFDDFAGGAIDQARINRALG